MLINIYPIFQVNNQDNKKGKKSDLLKKQIMLEIAKDSSECVPRARGFSMGKLSNTGYYYNY